MGAAAPTAPSDDGGRVVQAAGRFRELVVGRPWRRRRRALLAGAALTVLLLVAALTTVIFLPALQLREVTVAGTGYLQQEEIQDVAAPRLGDSVLLLPTGALAEQVEQIPGVESAEVERVWPDGARISVTEAAPVAVLTRTDGTTAVIDAHGEELPAAAGEGQSLTPLAVESGAEDPESAATAMSEVLATVPSPLRGAITQVTASSASDVTLELALEDGGAKTVVWGDAHDAELKAEVVQALLGRPGDVIDVSSPVAPVTR
ncbi:cell division protein FtsQ/DivIB [Brachybacterium saurashtrense]|uniref:cell division protein FtsQ/DivIB n=1 Tax=Brachybacterium saurashtrense TaxID=556288 RepID=UPI001F499D2D|nr:FtsQ-type POTRA domain-containing protein [Brachybacterium saurashtrense]